MKYYSKSTKGFYDTALFSVGDMPTDRVPVSEEVYVELLREQALGKQIVPNGAGFPEAVEPVVPLPDAKKAKQSEIKNDAEAFLQSLAVEYGAMEKLTWDQQAIEADALARDPEAAAPLVRSIAAGRGMGVLELAGRIRANHAGWASLSGYIVGRRLAYQDALDAAGTVEEVAAITPVYSLP